MKKFKTDDIRISIFLRRVEEDQIIDFYFSDKDDKTLEESRVILPAKICKQQFNDANLTQHIINFFIKE